MLSMSSSPPRSITMNQDVIAPINQINKDIKREYKSLRNRLQSISLDSEFLSHKVLPHFPDYPLIPNERCGLWYCNPMHYKDTCYFKSTDGHVNQWDFSCRRLNFHLLPCIAENSGIIVVDSTRRGKKIPDALSKTIPIWCAVLNTLMLESIAVDNSQEVLYVPPSSVGESEYHSIKERIPHLVEKLKKLDVIDGSSLYEMLGGRLLRPFWVYPGSHLLQSSVDPFTGESTGEKWEASKDDNIIPLILCTVSYRAQDGVDKRHGFTYVQGGADDHELWSHGLNSQDFWSNISFLADINNSEEQLQSFVSKLVSQEERETSQTFKHIDRITREISLGSIADGLEINSNVIEDLREKFSLVIVLSTSITISKDIVMDEGLTAFLKIYKLQSGSKRSSRDLRVKLLEIAPLIQDHLSRLLAQDSPILLCCNSGSDMSIAVLLVALSLNYRLDWSFEAPANVNKITVKRHLAKVISHLQGRNVNPSRATLNSVNSFLM